MTGGSALVHPTFPYAVVYDDPVGKSVMGDEWKLETYRRQKQHESVELLRKKGNDATYEFDFNDDDRTDARATLPMPDLLFVNKRTNARLEVSTILLDVLLERKELRVLLDDVVQGGNGTRSLFVGFGRAAAGVQKRFGSRLVDSQLAKLDGKAGLVATIEYANLDQLELDPDARSRRTRLFLVRAPFDYYATRGGSDARYHRYRVLMLVEYSNTPEDFEEQYPEFLRLMSKLHLVGDERMLTYLHDLLEPCAIHKSANASMKLEISPTGQATARDVVGMERFCVNKVVAPYPFAATGKERELTGSYDFSRPATLPDWLAQGQYAEQGGPTAEAKEQPSSAPAAPSDAPAAPPSAPAAPPNTPETPEAPAPQPDAAPPTSSSGNFSESGKP